MEGLRQYILSVCVAAMICGILINLAPKGACSSVLKIICGVFLAVSVLRPVLGLDFDAWIESVSTMYTSDGDAAVAFGRETGREALSQRIKNETEAYILDKAACLGADILAEVVLNTSDPPLPVAVTLHGDISPYAKQMLENIITEDLGIAKENQRWTG